MDGVVNSDRSEGMVPTAIHPLSTLTVLQKKVMLVLPWLKHTNPLTAFCAMQLADRRRTSTMLNFGDAFVAHSRNSCADHFLQSNMEWMLTIDDDMVIPFGSKNWFNAHTGFNLPDKFAGLNAVDRLLSHGKTLVGALYFGRHAKGGPVYNEASRPDEAEYARRAPHDLIKPTRWVGTGCMLIHRSVYEDIEKKFPRLGRGANKMGGQWFSSSEHTSMDWIDRTRQMLSEGPMDGRKAMKAFEMLEQASAEAKKNSSLAMGEDVQFCIRAKESGHQPFVDMGLVCGHMGHTIFGPKNTSPK